MTEDERRVAVVAEARTWLRTPYVSCGNIKGVGVDCAMLLLEVFRQPRGPVPADYDPRPYSPDWHLHQNEELYLAGMGLYSHRVEVARPADILVYRFGKTASHGAIVVDDELMIHAHRQHRGVELCERRAFASRLDAIYSVFGESS